MCVYFVEGCLEIYVVWCDRELQRYVANDSTFWCLAGNMLGNILYMVSVFAIMDYLHTLDHECPEVITTEKQCFTAVRDFESGPRWRDIKVICVIADQIYLIACLFPIYDLFQDWREHNTTSARVLPLDNSDSSMWGTGSSGIVRGGQDEPGPSQPYALLLNDDKIIPSSGQLFVHRPPSLSDVHGDFVGGGFGGGGAALPPTTVPVNNTSPTTATTNTTINNNNNSSMGGFVSSSVMAGNPKATIHSSMSFSDLTSPAAVAAAGARQSLSQLGTSSSPNSLQSAYEPPPLSPSRMDSL